MAESRRASRRAIGRPAKGGRDKFSSSADSAALAGIRELARRKQVRMCDVIDMAFFRYLQEDSANRNDALMAPMINRMLDARLTAMEAGLRTMIARLAHETLTIQYVLFNFLTEAGIPPSKVEKWRKDGRRFAIQEYRRKPRVALDEAPPDGGDGID